MAKSMFEIIESGIIEVNHNGEDVNFELPEWMKELNGILEDEKAMNEWAKRNNIGLATHHNNIAKTIIDLRATIRPADVAGKEKGSKVKVSLIEDAENAQERADAFIIKPATRPGTGGSGKAKAEIETLAKVIKAMQAAGLDEITIRSMQEPTFGRTKVNAAFVSLTN